MFRGSSRHPAALASLCGFFYFLENRKLIANGKLHEKIQHTVITD